MKTLVIASHGRNLGWSVNSVSGDTDKKGRYLFCSQEAFWYDSYESAIKSFVPKADEIIVPGKFTFIAETQMLKPWQHVQPS
ncbi:MAG: hypothetical protein M1608_02820 [Candidatus Omnitrophica bacterium]|nr:hypothetical protein [Candidatus Omnitrophota bacterium]